MQGSVGINTDCTDEALTVHGNVMLIYALMQGSVGINTDCTDEALTVHGNVMLICALTHMHAGQCGRKH